MLAMEVQSLLKKGNVYSQRFDINLSLIIHYFVITILFRGPVYPCIVVSAWLITCD